MIKQEILVRQRGSYEMVNKEVSLSLEKMCYALCRLAQYLVHGWKLRAWQKLQPLCQSLVYISISDEKEENRIHFSSGEIDLEPMARMAERAAQAGSEKVKLEEIKRCLLKSCYIENPDKKLRRLSVDDLTAAIVYLNDHSSEEIDLLEAHHRRLAESAARRSGY